MCLRSKEICYKFKLNATRVLCMMPECMDLLSNAVESNQNRRQKVFNRELYVCAGGLERLRRVLKSYNSIYLIVFHISIWGGLELCFGGLSPPKPRRGDGTESNARRKCFSCIALSQRPTAVEAGVHCICTLPSSSSSRSWSPPTWYKVVWCRHASKRIEMTWKSRINVKK